MHGLFAELRRNCRFFFALVVHDSCVDFHTHEMLVSMVVLVFFRKGYRFWYVPFVDFNMTYRFFFLSLHGWFGGFRGNYRFVHGPFVDFRRSYICFMVRLFLFVEIAYFSWSFVGFRRNYMCFMVRVLIVVETTYLSWFVW